jgi:hypothetical protein
LQSTIPIGVLARPTSLTIPASSRFTLIRGIFEPGDIVLRLHRQPGRPDLDDSFTKRVRVTFDLGISTPKARKWKGSIISLFNDIRMAINEELRAKCERFFR